MTGLEKQRLKRALEQGTISSEMKRKDIYIEMLLELISQDNKLVKDLIKRIK